MDETKKIQAFEYIVIQLAKQHLGKRLDEQLTEHDVNKFNSEGGNDFSKLKLLKLLFLVCVSAPNKPLLPIFNRFYAMQYGPVELDIYEEIDKAPNSFKCITVNTQHTKIKYQEYVRLEKNFAGTDLMSLINSSITILLSEKSNFTKIRNWDLVEITHTYSSWQYSFRKANILGKGLFPMLDSLISKEHLKVAIV